jgi:hypothetical protein
MHPLFLWPAPHVVVAVPTVVANMFFDIELAYKFYSENCQTLYHFYLSTIPNIELPLQPIQDFTGEVDTRQCRFTMKVARFALAGAAWSRGRKREVCGGFPVEVEREKEGENGPVWARHSEKEMGPRRCTRLSEWGS